MTRPTSTTGCCSGLKGTMSEAELHFIRARLQGGILSKARRGELQMPLPVGLVYDAAGKVVLDPDSGVQSALRHVFATFARTGSARAVVHAFDREGLLFPAGSAKASATASWRGASCRTGGCCARCTTPAMPARSRMAAAGPARPRDGKTTLARAAARAMDGADP